MIRNAVLHIMNEQPLVADLYRLPQAGDAGLVCTNLRMLNGSRPVFIDDIRSTFFFPYDQISFVEIPAAAMAAGEGHELDVLPAGVPAVPSGTDRAGSREVPGTEPVGAGAAAPVEAAPEPGSGADLELDEDFLRRIREV